MGDAQWFYTQNNQQQGPVTLAALQSMAAAGQLGGNDLVWSEGMTAWQPAASTPAVFATAPGIAPQPAAPAGAPFAPQLNYGGYPQRQPNMYGASSHEAVAKSALIYAIFGFFCCFILNIVAIVKANNAKAAMTSSQNFQGQGMATAAQIISWTTIGLAALGIVANIVVALTKH